AAEITGPEFEVFRDRQRRLQGVLVAEVMGLFGNGLFRVTPYAGEVTGGCANQAGDDSQQGGFAGAVAAADLQGLSRSHGEIEPGKHVTAAADAAEVFGLKPHRRRLRR